MHKAQTRGFVAAHKPFPLPKGTSKPFPLLKGTSKHGTGTSMLGGLCTPSPFPPVQGCGYERQR